MPYPYVLQNVIEWSSGIENEVYEGHVYQYSIEIILKSS